jgi:hypothetical protein
MNEAQLERALLSLTPVQPSADLLQRVEHDMGLQSFFQDAGAKAAQQSSATRRSTWHVPVAWASLGAAAAAALVISLMPPRDSLGSGTTLAAASSAAKTTSPTSPKGLVVGNAANATPVSTDRKVLSTEDRGIVNLEGGQVMRQIVVRYLEKRLIVDTATGQQAIVELPVEEVLTVPVKVQ